MAATKVNFQTDANLKIQAERLFDQMGLNMTSALNIFLKATVQAGELPFPIMGDEAAVRKRIHKALMEAQTEAANPNTKYLTEEEVLGRFNAKYGL